MERDAVRFRAPYIQECRILTARGPASALASNVSLNGLFIVADEVLDVGQRVQVSFPLPGGAQLLDAEAEVIWQSPEPPDYGLHFTAVSPEARRRVEELVQSYQRAQRPHLPFRQPHSGVVRVPYVRRCRLVGRSGTVPATVCNVSALGVFVATPARLELGEALRLSFPLPGGHATIEAVATVAWSNAEETRALEILPRGYGLRFEALTAGELKRIEGLVAELCHVPRVLLVEDNPGDVDLVRLALDPKAWSLAHAGDLAAAARELSKGHVDVVLLDLSLPDARGIDAVQRLGAQFSDVPIVVLTGLDDEALSLQAVHEGAQDYLVKRDLNERSLVHALRYAVERQRAETALSHLAAVVESSADAILRCTREGAVASWNRGAQRIFGLTADGAVGRALADLFAEPQRPEVQALFESLRLDKGSAAFDAPGAPKDGRAVHVALTVSPIRDRVGRVVAASVVARDVTRQKELEAEVLALSLHDELTGLLNRRGFIQLAQQQMKVAQRSGRGLVLLYVDLDGLKAINDRFGHAEGDRALTATGVLLKKTFRETSIVGRLGGDEFVVLVVDAAPASAPALVQRLQRSVARFNSEMKSPYELSMSVGTAVSRSQRPATLEVLWARADAAMYKAKPRAATPRVRAARGARRPARRG